MKMNKEQKVKDLVESMMKQLDYTKHDKRNDKRFIKNTLTKYYERNLESEITAKQWDEMFAIYTPYNGTY